MKKLIKFLKGVKKRMAQLNLSPAWDIYYMQVKTLFADDPEVNVVYDRDNQKLKLYVDSTEKAEALDKLMPAEMTWGNVTMDITVYPSNVSITLNDIKMTYVEQFEAAFKGNQNFNFVKTINLLYNNPMTFVVFAPKIAQYYTDNMGDWNGFRSELYSDLAKEVFCELPGVYYCTDKVADNLTAWF